VRSVLTWVTRKETPGGERERRHFLGVDGQIFDFNHLYWTTTIENALLRKRTICALSLSSTFDGDLPYSPYRFANSFF